MLVVNYGIGQATPTRDFNYNQGDLIVFKNNPKAGLFRAEKVVVGETWPEGAPDPVSTWMTRAHRKVTERYSESWSHAATAFQLATADDLMQMEHSQLDPLVGKPTPEELEEPAAPKQPTRWGVFAAAAGILVVGVGLVGFAVTRKVS